MSAVSEVGGLGVVPSGNVALTSGGVSLDGIARIRRFCEVLNSSPQVGDTAIVGILTELCDVIEALAHESSPSVDARGAESRDASSPTVGDASGVAISTTPDAPSGGVA